MTENKPIPIEFSNFSAARSLLSESLIMNMSDDPSNCGLHSKLIDDALLLITGPHRDFDKYFTTLQKLNEIHLPRCPNKHLLELKQSETDQTDGIP
jgi:5-formaminoimidazole-4-carboxamide-1-beta-D-ribofuranosyl 5'-monophosphate synthetase